MQGPWPGPDPPTGKGPQGPEKGAARLDVLSPNLGMNVT